MSKQHPELVTLKETAVAGRSSAVDNLAFSWHREGGIAGFCDDLTGLTQATSCKGINASGMLTAEQLTQLYDWNDTLQSFDLEQADPAGAADGMRITLLFKGNGRSQPSKVQKQAVQDLAGAIFAAVSSPANSSADATTTVNAFLNHSGDYAR